MCPNKPVCSLSGLKLFHIQNSFFSEVINLGLLTYKNSEKPKSEEWFKVVVIPWWFFFNIVSWKVFLIWPVKSKESKTVKKILLILKISSFDSLAIRAPFVMFGLWLPSCSNLRFIDRSSFSSQSGFKV